VPGSVDELADALALAVERWVFPTRSPRTLLVTCPGGPSSQVAVSGPLDAWRYVSLGLAGLCGVRSSTQPKASPGRVESIEALHLDVDSPGNVELARHVAAILAERLAAMGAEPLAVFTGGKGYALRVFLDREYASISPEQYAALGREVASLADVTAVEVPHPVSSHIRVPFTRHEGTGWQVLLYDWRRGEHVRDPARTAEMVDAALGRPLPFMEELLGAARRAQPLAAGAGGRRGGIPAWVARLVEYLKETGELCHMGRVAVAQWLARAGWSEDEIVEVFRHARDFKESKTRYHVRYEMRRVQQGRRPVGCRRVEQECQQKVPRPLCGPPAAST
jgi:hypothetical protein